MSYEGVTDKQKIEILLLFNIFENELLLKNKSKDTPLSPQDPLITHNTQDPQPIDNLEE